MHVHMASSLSVFLILLFLTGLPGADSVSTVSRVTVQRGRSVTILCHYDLKYKNDVKYWCRGYYWFSCSVVVRTDSPKNYGEVSITDDPAHQIFTVSMKNLQEGNSGYYWCAVEIGDEWTPDDHAYLYLSVTAGTPGLWVDQQEVTGVEGGSISVLCRYSNHGSMKKWCRSGGSCVPGNSGDWTKQYWRHFTTESSTSQQTTATTVSTSTSAATTITVTQTGPTVEKRISVTGNLLIALGMLFLVVAIVLVTWKVWSNKKNKRRGAEGRRADLTTTLDAEGTYSAVNTRKEARQTTTWEPEVMYSTVNTRKKPRQATADSENEVTYSTVFTRTKPLHEPSEDPAGEVTYSSVVLLNPQPRADAANDTVYSSVFLPKK